MRVSRAFISCNCLDLAMFFGILSSGLGGEKAFVARAICTMPAALAEESTTNRSGVFALFSFHIYELNMARFAH